MHRVVSVEPLADCRLKLSFDDGLTGEVDLSDLARSRYAVNLTGAYSRWDLLSLNVREAPYAPINPEPDRMDEFEARLKRLEHLANAPPEAESKTEFEE